MQYVSVSQNVCFLLYSMLEQRQQSTGFMHVEGFNEMINISFLNLHVPV